MLRGFSEVVLAVECQVEGEAKHEDGNIHYLPEDRDTVLGGVLVASFVFLHIRLDDAVGLVRHDFATPDNLLPLLY